MVDYVKINMWIIYILSAVVATGLIHLVLARINRHLIRKITQSNALTARAFLKALSVPMGFCIWLLGLYVTASIFLAY
ncbi:TPA: mechanosensitive ion channel family protein, partial [Legionella pneumophila]